MRKGAKLLFVSVFLIVLSLTAIVSARPSFFTIETGVGATRAVDEDSGYTFDFNTILEVSEPPMRFNILGGSITLETSPDFFEPGPFPWLVLDEITGIILINSTTDAQTGLLEIEVNVADFPAGTGSSDLFFFNIIPVNDAPIFPDLTNRSFNMSEPFEYLINVTDEEDNFPVTFSISFLGCEVKPWSDRDCSIPADWELFSNLQYSTDENLGQIDLGFTPSRNDVGVYEIEFSATDSGTTNLPAPAIGTKTVNFTVLNQNANPFFTYACENEGTATEGTEYLCHINATDIDEVNFLTFESNTSWFSFFGTSETSWNLLPTSLNPWSFNFTIPVDFIPTDAEVGDWLINITITDNSDLPIKKNSTIISLSIANIDDSVIIEPIPNVTVFSSNTGFFYVNATDDDLLILDKTIYDESISFESNNPKIDFIGTSPTDEPNKTQAIFTFAPLDLGEGITEVIITASDANLFSSSQTTFNISVELNSPPLWNPVVQTTYQLQENLPFPLDLSSEVSDPDNDPITFQYSSDNEFPAFSLNPPTGEISFTPSDGDIGVHTVTINATDRKTATPLDFTFIVANVNDIPLIQPFPSDPNVASVNFAGNILDGLTVMEDAEVVLALWVDDDDFKIPAAQKALFYREDITIDLTIEGPTTNLFDFVLTDDFSSPNIPQGSAHQRLEFDAAFIPLKADLGPYNITINISDQSGINDSISFQLSVTEVQHNPVITPIGNINTSVEELLIIDVNSTDLEDIDENAPDSNLSYTLTNLTFRGDFLTIDPNTGIIEFQLTNAYAGRWEYNVTVNDSSGLTDSEFFNVSVYDIPKITLPLETPSDFFFEENTTVPIAIAASQNISENLTYTFFINNVEKQSMQESGLGTSFDFDFTPDFTSETTCSGPVEFVLNVSNPKLSLTRSWTVEVNHTNFPLSFVSEIENQTGGSPIRLALSDYFIDVDASDGCVNQIITFTHTLLSSSGGAITVTTTDWTDASVTPEIEFSITEDGSGFYSITAVESSLQVLSNNFSVDITATPPPPPVVTTITGGPSGTKPSNINTISLDIIVPPPVSAEPIDLLFVPVKLRNNGKRDLRNINISAEVTKGGKPITDLIVSFNTTSILLLKQGVTEEVTMTVEINTEEKGIFKVKITGDVRTPSHTATEDFFIEIEDELEIIERIIFTEELIINNPECTELKELVDEARVLVEQNDLEGARKKTEEAVEACSAAISQPITSRVRRRVEEKMFGVIAASSLIAFILGFGYYYYKRTKLRKEVSSIPMPKPKVKRTTFNNYQSYNR